MSAAISSGSIADGRVEPGDDGEVHRDLAPGVLPGLLPVVVDHGDGAGDDADLAAGRAEPLAGEAHERRVGSCRRA